VQHLAEFSWVHLLLKVTISFLTEEGMNVCMGYVWLVAPDYSCMCMCIQDQGPKLINYEACLAAKN